MKQTPADSLSKLAQVAKELHRLADKIGAGTVQISGVDLALSDSVTLKVKQKMTGEKVVFDLKIQAFLATSEVALDRKSLRKIAMKKKSVKVKHSSAKATMRPYGVKALKKKYTSLWRLISAQIKKAECPDHLIVNELKAVSAEYADSAPPEWATLWRESETLVEQCVASAQHQDFPTAQELLRDIAKAKKSCHKVYK